MGNDSDGVSSVIGWRPRDCAIVIDGPADARSTPTSSSSTLLPPTFLCTVTDGVYADFGVEFDDMGDPILK